MHMDRMRIIGFVGKCPLLQIAERNMGIDSIDVVWLVIDMMNGSECPKSVGNVDLGRRDA